MRLKPTSFFFFSTQRLIVTDPVCVVAPLRRCLCRKTGCQTAEHRFFESSAVMISDTIYYRNPHIRHTFSLLINKSTTAPWQSFCCADVDPQQNSPSFWIYDMGAYRRGAARLNKCCQTDLWGCAAFKASISVKVKSFFPGFSATFGIGAINCGEDMCGWKWLLMEWCWVNMCL